MWDPIDQQKFMEMTPSGRARIIHWGDVYHVGDQPNWGLLYGDVIYEGYYIEGEVYGRMYYGFGEREGTGGEIGLGDAKEFAEYLAVKPGMKHVPNLHGNSFQQHHYEHMIKVIDPNVILLLMEASPEVIARRMKEAPHEPQRIKEEDIPTLLEMFREAFRQSILVNRMVLDTSDATVGETFEQFKRDVEHFLTEKDMLRMILHSLRTGKAP
jgi:hypothetical protein